MSEKNGVGLTVAEYFEGTQLIVPTGGIAHYIEGTDKSSGFMIEITGMTEGGVSKIGFCFSNVEALDEFLESVIKNVESVKEQANEPGTNAAKGASSVSDNG